MADLIEGAKITMGGIGYTVPPLSFKQLRALQGTIARVGAITNQMSDGQISDVVAIVTAALSRNYPEMTADKVEEALDLGNARYVIAAIMGVSGLVSSGEAMAGS